MSHQWNEESARSLQEELRKFLCEALKYGYGSDNKPLDFSDGGHEQIFESPDHLWKYRDQWYGGEPYSGITKVEYLGEVRWTMVYWGKVFPNVDKHEVYKCLIPALAKFDHKRPIRGPETYLADSGLAVYLNRVSYGNLNEFHGMEIIVGGDDASATLKAGLIGKLFEATPYGSWPHDLRLLYEMHYRGGFVNLR